MSPVPFMPKATAIWLVNNTTLTFEQIAKFCQLHLLEVEGIANGEVMTNIAEENPIINGQLTRDEISRCEKDSDAELKINSLPSDIVLKTKKKSSNYIPVARRRDKPSAIMWLVKNYPDISDADIISLLGSTKRTVASVRDKTYKLINEVTPKDPVLLGLCSQTALDNMVKKITDTRSKSAAEEGKL